MLGAGGSHPVRAGAAFQFSFGHPSRLLRKVTFGRIPSLLLCSAKIDESLNQLDSLRENCMVRSVSGELSMLVIAVQIVVF